MMFNELILLYCYYRDLEEEELFCEDWDAKERYWQYRILSDSIKRMLADMCAQG